MRQASHPTVTTLVRHGNRGSAVRRRLADVRGSEPALVAQAACECSAERAGVRGLAPLCEVPAYAHGLFFRASWMGVRLHEVVRMAGRAITPCSAVGMHNIHDTDTQAQSRVSAHTGLQPHTVARSQSHHVSRERPRHGPA